MNRLTQDNITSSNYLDSQIESSKAKESEAFNKIKIGEGKLKELDDKLENLRNSKLSIKNLWNRASTRVSIWKERANLNNLYVTQIKHRCAALLFQSVKDEVGKNSIGIDVILKNANTTLKKIDHLKYGKLWEVGNAFECTHKEEVEHLRKEIEENATAANENGSSNITSDAPTTNDETNIQTDKGTSLNNVDTRNVTENPQSTTPEKSATPPTSTLGDPEDSAINPSQNEAELTSFKEVNNEENLGDVSPEEAHPEGDGSGEINGPTAEPVLDGANPESAKSSVIDDKRELEDSSAAELQGKPATSEEIAAEPNDDATIEKPDVSEKRLDFDADSTEHGPEASTHIDDKTSEIDKSGETNKSAEIRGTTSEIEAKAKELKNAVQGCVVAVSNTVNKAGSGSTASAFIKSGTIAIGGITKQVARLIQKTYNGEDSEATIKPKHDEDKSVNTEAKSEKASGTKEVSKAKTAGKKRVRKNDKLDSQNDKLDSQKAVEIFANYKINSYIDEHSEELSADPILYNGANKIVKFIPTEKQKKELSKSANSSKKRAQNAIDACKIGDQVYFEEAEGKSIDKMSAEELDKIPVADRLNFIKDILCQVAFLNKVGILHRDFNPGNIIIDTQNGKSGARLIDFGGAICTSDLDIYPENFRNAMTQFTPPEGIEGTDFGKYNEYGAGISILGMIFGKEWHNEIPTELRKAILFALRYGKQAKPQFERALENTIDKWISDKESRLAKKCEEIGFTPEQTEFVRTLLVGLLQPDSEKRMSALDAARATDKFINPQAGGNLTKSKVNTEGSKTPKKPTSPAAEKTLDSVADSSGPKDEGEIETKEIKTPTPTHTDATPAPTKVTSVKKADAPEPEKTKASGKTNATTEVDAEEKDKKTQKQISYLKTVLQNEGKWDDHYEAAFVDRLNEKRAKEPNMSHIKFGNLVNKEQMILFLAAGGTGGGMSLSIKFDDPEVQAGTEYYQNSVSDTTGDGKLPEGSKTASTAAKVDTPKSDADIEAGKDKAVENAVVALQGNGIGQSDIEVFKGILNEIRGNNPEMSPADFQEEVNREMKYLYQIKDRTDEARKIKAKTNFMDISDRTAKYNSGPKNKSVAAKKDLPSTKSATESKKTEASGKTNATTEVDTEKKDKAVENQINILNLDLNENDLENLTEAEEKIFRDRLNKLRQDEPSISLYDFNERARDLGNVFFSVKNGEDKAINSTEAEVKEIKTECCKAAIESGLENNFKDNEITLSENDKTKFRERLNSVMRDNPDISLKDFKSEVNEEIETLKYLKQYRADSSISSSDDSKISIAREYGYNEIADSIESMLDPEERSATLEGTTDKDVPTSETGATKAETASTVGATAAPKLTIKEVLKAIAAKGKELIQAAKKLGQGTFGTVFAASVDVLGKTLNIVAKTMNSAKQAADGKTTFSENLNNLQGILNMLHEDGTISFKEKDVSISKGLNQCVTILSQYEKAYQGEAIGTRISQLKTQLTDLKEKASQLETMENNLQGNPDFKKTIQANIEKTKREFKEIAKAIKPLTTEELNTLNDADALVDLYKEIYVNAKINMEIIRESEKAGQTPLEYAEAHHIPLCLSAMPDDGKVIPDDQLIDFARKKAHEVLKSDSKAIISTQISGENLNKCFQEEKKNGPSKFDKLSMKARVKVAQDFFTATKLLNAAGVYHNDLHFGNMQVNIINEDNAEGYILDFGRAIEINGKNYNFFENNFIDSKDGRFSPPEMFTENPDVGEITSSKGLEKCAVYGLGTNLFSLLGGDKGKDKQESYFTRDKFYGAVYDYFNNKNDEGTLTEQEEELVSKIESDNDLNELEKNQLQLLSRELYFQDIENNVKEVFKEYSPEVQDKIIALMQGTTNIDPQKRMTLEEAQRSLDELKLLIDPEQNRTEQNRTEQNVNSRSTKSKEISAKKPIDSSEVSPASLSSSEEQPVDDVTAIIDPTTVGDTEFQPLAEPITKDCYTITKIATESVGAGSFGTVFKVMANVAGNIAGKAQEVQAALKRMNGNTNELSQISSYFKYAIDQLNDPSVSNEQKGECLAGVKQNIEYLLKNYNKGSIQKQLQSFSRTLQKLPQRDPRIQKFKSDTANLLSKNVPQNLENLEKNLLSKLNDPTAVIYAQEWAADIEKITNVLDSVNLEGEFEKLKDASREIFNNAYMYVGMLEKAKEEGLSPLEYAAKHNITLCFSAIPSDEKLNELNSITDENQKKKMLLKWSYETAQKILENPDDGLLFSLVPGKSMASIGYDEINKLSHQGGLGILDGFFQTMEELDKLGLIHNDAHEGNVNVDIKDENNAKGYVFDHGISVLTSDPNQFHDVSARTHRPIISPNIRNGKPNGPKDNSYAIGMKIPQIYLGIEGQKLYNQYFVNFEKLVEFGLVDDSFIQQIKQDKCNVWEINERLQKAGVNLDEIYNFLQESFYQELKNKIQEGISSRKGAFGHDAEACKILDKLLETLNPDSDKRITSTEARALIKKLKKYENSKIA